MSFVQESTDSFTDAYESIRKEARNLQKRVKKQTRKPLRQLRRNGLVKRAQNLESDAREQIAGGVETVLGYLQIASKSDLQRIDRRLEEIERRLGELSLAEKFKRINVKRKK